MKIAILNDTHLGVKNGSDLFMDYVEKFYENTFFPYCIENNIKKIIHLGDYFDHRKYVNFHVLSRDKKIFIDKLEANGMTMDIIPGNHDVYWNNTNSLCSLINQLSQYPFINIYMKPVVNDYDGLAIALLPWITADTAIESNTFIDTAAAPILLGHLELAGFPITHGGNVISHGSDPNQFKRFEMVLSGHYHTSSKKDNIHYLGTQFEITWADVNDPKYFHVLDTSTRELTKVRNPYKLYYKIVYDDSQEKILIPAEVRDSKNAYIKVVVAHKKDPYTFDKFLDIIQQLNPFDVKVIESFDEFGASSINDQDISLQDTKVLVESYIDAIDTTLDKNKLKILMNALYVEALNQVSE